jgi:hypothetical protein
MTEDEFYETLDAFTNKAIFKTDEYGRIVRDENGEVQKLRWPDDDVDETDGRARDAADALTAEEISGTRDARRRGREFDSAHARAVEGNGTAVPTGGPIGRFIAGDE